MEYFEVIFNSHAKFAQMKVVNDQQSVRMFCQEDDGDGGGKEIIINSPTRKDYSDEQAQFSVSKKEAELMIGVFKLHFGL
jgi:hypothetical protein